MAPKETGKLHKLEPRAAGSWQTMCYLFTAVLLSAQATVLGGTGQQGLYSVQVYYHYILIQLQPAVRA